MGRAIIAGLILLLFHGVVFGQNLLSQPESAEYDPVRHRYFAGSAANGRIIEVDTLGNQSVYNEEMIQSLGLHVRGDTLFVASNGGPLSGVIGFDLTTDTRVIHIAVPGQGMLNDITSDSSGFLYVTDYNTDRIYKIDPLAGTVSNFVTTGLNQPNGIKFDPVNNRVLFLNEQAPGRPVCAIDLADSTYTNLISTNLGESDGIVYDLNGNWYISDWNTSSVFRYNNDFSSDRELVSSGHGGPADIFFDTVNSVLVVPNYMSNSLDFIDISHGPKAVETEFDDSSGGDSDNFLDPGESIDLLLGIVNQDAFDYSDVTVTLTSSSSDLTLGRATVAYGPLSALQAATNELEPFELIVDAASEPQMVTLDYELNYVSHHGSMQKNGSLDIAIGEASILVVDDTRGHDDSYSYLRETLLLGDRLYRHCPSTLGDGPDLSLLNEYAMVLWFTGDPHSEALTASEVSLLSSYLDNGGNLLLTGQGLAGQLETSNPSFLSDYLHAEYLRTQHYPYFVGESSGQVYDLSDSLCVSCAGGAQNQTVMDHIGPVGEGVAELVYYGQSDWSAVSYDGDFRTLFFSFGLESVSEDFQTWTDREVVLNKAFGFLDWLNPNHCCVVPGDVDFDGAGPNIADLVFLVAFMFSGGDAPPCMQTADIDGSGTGPDIADLVYLVAFMFSGGDPLPSCS